MHVLSHWKWWAVGLLFGVLTLVGGICCSPNNSSGPVPTDLPASDDEEPSALPTVHVVTPQKGAMDRTTVQPGSVQAFESVQIFAAVAGYLARQNVDIGSRVKKNDVLAIIAVPELEKSLQKYQASLTQAKAKVQQMDARVAVAKADLETAKAVLAQAEASHKSAEAWSRFRDKQLERMKELYALKSIDERLVDETRERAEAAKETVRSAVATIAAAKAGLVAGDAKVNQAEADVKEADAEVLVVQSELERASVLVDFATIKAPFDGVVTQRSQFPGDYVRAASGGSQVPLLTVERTDLMRVVVQIPDHEAPYADPGDPAVIEFDAIHNEHFKSKVARVSNSLDPQTRLMRVEIDLPNTSGHLRNGMYGQVTILLEKAPDLLSIPKNCLVGPAEKGHGKVFVVRDGHVVLVPVQLGAENGQRVGVCRGLSTQDHVVTHPSTALSDGEAVVEIAGRD